MAEEKKIKVALLEDSKHVAELMKELLEKQGFEVIHSESASDEWLDELKREGVERYLLDIEQERKPLGLQFADRVKKEIENARIIMMSADFEHKEKALEKGHDFLEKPFTVDSFYRLIEKRFKR